MFFFFIFIFFMQQICGRLDGPKTDRLRSQSILVEFFFTADLWCLYMLSYSPLLCISVVIDLYLVNYQYCYCQLVTIKTSNLNDSHYALMKSIIQNRKKEIKILCHQQTNAGSVGIRIVFDYRIFGYRVCSVML